MGNYFTLFYPQFIHNTCYSITSEQSHKIIFQTEVKTGRTGITLSPGTTTQLQINTSRLVTLGTNYMQSSQINDALAQFDVSPTTCHVRRYCHGTELSCPNNNLSFALMLLSVQNIVRNSPAFNHAGKCF